MRNPRTIVGMVFHGLAKLLTLVIARSVLLLDRPKVTQLHVRNSTIEFRHITGIVAQECPADAAARGSNGKCRNKQRGDQSCLLTMEI